MNFYLFPSSCLHKENYVACTNHAPHPCTLPMWKVLKGPDYAVSLYKMVTSAVCGPVYSGKLSIKLYNAKTKLLSHACSCHLRIGYSYEYK